MLLDNQVSNYGNKRINVYENDININENNNNILNSINSEEVITRTPIQDFYAGRNVFITGATGFLGKTMIEKLLRVCPEISTIYILIRPKKKNNIIDRIEDIFNEPIFDNLKNNSPKLRHKVVAIPGDCSFPDLGLTLEDRKKIIDEVSIVFHNAATVKFEEKLQVATTINAGGTLSVINLCKEMKNLKAMIHVSTAYANCHLDTIDEQFYPHPFTYDDLRVIVNSLPDQTIDAVLPRLLDKWPNTYTYTKALAENVVRENSQDLPIGIFRPAIILSCANDPLSGWIDNYYGPVGVAAAVAVGFLRSIRINLDVTANLVPVDYTVNAILASAWDVSTQPDKRGKNMLIYNYVSTVENPVTWGFYIDNCLRFGRDFPLKQSLWYVTMTTYQSKVMYFLANLVLHYLPALLADVLAICIGHKPRVVKSVTKVNKLLSLIQPFMLKSWSFKNDNVQRLWSRLDSKDKLTLRFSFDEFDWKHYLRCHMKGVRSFLFKEDTKSLESARKRLRRLRWVHEAVKIILSFFALILIWKLFSAIF